MQPKFNRLSLEVAVIVTCNILVCIIINDFKFIGNS